ncbi:GTP pyrophosphokinase family protein [Rhizobium sp.]|uniref:GTP pyrophosphokinase family protein n=1 Tax=Rhizobium sp. TaxID=391 RepID=UPI0034C5F74A
MADINLKEWLDFNHRRFLNLTDAVVSITTNLLTEHGVTFLAVSGRTKSVGDCLSKAKRKNYRNPLKQLTDISGVRIILFFEHDIESVSNIIRSSFRVDSENSLNKDDVLSANELGYRSVHFVCDLGEPRNLLPEYVGLKDLKFEFQVRTVLQHAWAELAHDRNYKFSGQLPKHLERKLYLLAGQLELADKGFSELSSDIDAYMAGITDSAAEGSLDIEINSLSLEGFVRQWCASNGVSLESPRGPHNGYATLIDELERFGVTTLERLSAIIPPEYAKAIRGHGSTVWGIVRDWMVISDVDGFLRRVTPVDWVFEPEDFARFKGFLNSEQIATLKTVVGIDEFEPPDWGYVEGEDED